VRTSLLPPSRVFIDEIIEGFHASSVAFHNRTGMAALVEHMHGHGHERIALLSGPTEQTDGRERREGFLAAMAAEGLTVTPGTIRNCDWDIRSGFNEARQLLSSANPPSAVVASSAELALGALAAAKSLGLDLPGQMALASFDDPYFAALLEPALTAIAYDAPSMGAISARLLVSTIELGVPDYRSVRIDVHLVPRRSCGCEFDVAQALTAHPL
jgi:LacI family transcriptional regulator